jgi:hypothetical protein
MYSVVVAPKVGVICKGCGRGIEIDDEYVPGIRGVQFALKSQPSPPGTSLTDHLVRALRSGAWEKTLTCGNPDCAKTYEYRSEDLRLFDE